MGSYTSNSQDMVRHGTRLMGSAARSKLGEDDVLEIRRRRSEGIKFADLADSFGVSRQKWKLDRLSAVVEAPGLTLEGRSRPHAGDVATVEEISLTPRRANPGFAFLVPPVRSTAGCTDARGQLALTLVASSIPKSSAKRLFPDVPSTGATEPVEPRPECHGEDGPRGRLRDRRRERVNPRIQCRPATVDPRRGEELRGVDVEVRERERQGSHPVGFDRRDGRHDVRLGRAGDRPIQQPGDGEAARGVITPIALIRRPG